MSELAAIDIDRQPPPTATEIVDKLRAEVAKIHDHVDSARLVLGDDFDSFEESAELRQAVRRVAHQRYVGAHENQERLIGMLRQAEERVATETRIFTVVERLTCS